MKFMPHLSVTDFSQVEAFGYRDYEALGYPRQSYPGSRQGRYFDTERRIRVQATGELKVSTLELL